MRFQGLDLNLLVALEALLAEQNVSVAADRVCLSQSAMSGALNRLREFFGDELLTPMGRKMVLTPRAEELIEPVRNALLQIKTTITTKPVFDPASSTRRFSIIASDYATLATLADTLRGLVQEAPDVTFDLQPINEAAAERLERGDVDFLITLDQFVSPDHPSETLFTDDYVVAAWTGNDRIGEVLDEETYFELGHVIVQFGLSRTPAFDEWFLRTGRRHRRVEVVAQAFTVAPYLLIGTQRIATMHRRLAEAFREILPLRLYPAPFEIPPIRQVIQWHALKNADPGCVWLRQRLIEGAQG